MMDRHEIVGTITEVGSAVTNFKAGETVGVGCMVHSCHDCDSCEKGLEQYCESMVGTYSSVDLDGTVTQGGYSDVMVVNYK
jgi:D-arabinose 1-dehydrogenase-like Zn-dependent alcohol dehydrogenase